MHRPGTACLRFVALLAVTMTRTASVRAEPTQGVPLPTWVRSVETSGSLVRASVTDLAAAGRDIPGTVAALGLGLTRYEASEGSLEDLFVALTGEGFDVSG